MIVKRVVKVSLTKTIEGSDGLTAYAGTDLWRVGWTVVRSGKPDDMRASHYTEAAARLHVANLVEQRVEGLAVKDVYVARL